MYLHTVVWMDILLNICFFKNTFLSHFFLIFPFFFLFFFY
jgi:hypothetical protein